MAGHSGVYIIAEIASAHEGDVSAALRLVKLAAGTGTDAIKLQVFSRKKLLSRYHPKFDEFGLIEIDPDSWKKIFAYAQQYDVDIIVEPFDADSLEIAAASGAIGAYKVPTSDIGNLPFLENLGAMGTTIYLGAGGATSEEVSHALRILDDSGAHEVVIMHGFQSFPTRLDDSQLARIPYLRKVFKRRVGYADHIDADNQQMAQILPAMAIAAGATVIEKHITEDRNRRGLDYYSSLNPSEFTRLVTLLRSLPLALGETGPWSLSPAELEYRHLMKRQAVAAEALHANSPVEAHKVIFKRTNVPGLSPRELRNYYGRSLRRTVGPDEPLTAEDFQS